MSDSENKAGCSPVGARGKNLSLSQVEIEQLVDSITPEERHAIVDGLFDWFLGREHKLGGMTGTVLTIMIEKQVAYQAVCAARAKAGRKGGLIGGKASGEAKARYGNQNAKQNGPEGENAKQTQSKRKANAKQTQSKRKAISISMSISMSMRMMMSMRTRIRKDRQ